LIDYIQGLRTKFYSSLWNMR